MRACRNTLPCSSQTDENENAVITHNAIIPISCQGISTEALVSGDLVLAPEGDVDEWIVACRLSESIKGETVTERMRKATHGILRIRLASRLFETFVVLSVLPVPFGG
jgi:hypothetical protein